MASENDKSTAEHAVLAQWHALRNVKRKLKNTGFSEVRLYSSDASSFKTCQKSVSKTLLTARCVPEANFPRFSLDFGSLGGPFWSSGGLPGGFWSLLAALWAPLGGLLGALVTLLDAPGRLLGRSWPDFDAILGVSDRSQPSLDDPGSTFDHPRVDFEPPENRFFTR